MQNCSKISLLWPNTKAEYTQKHVNFGGTICACTYSYPDINKCPMSVLG